MDVQTYTHHIDAYAVFSWPAEPGAKHANCRYQHWACTSRKLFLEHSSTARAYRKRLESLMPIAEGWVINIDHKNA